jgi:ABC-2 family transporter protein
MIWVGWRQQRTEAVISVLVLVLLTALLVPTGIQMANAYHHDGLSACLGVDPSFACGNAIDSFHSRFGTLSGLINWFTLLPGLFGILLAAPFLIDLENGTYRLAWTQSISRGRWVAGKLSFAVAGTLLSCGVMVVLVTWWHTPFVHLEGRMDNSTYDAEGTVALGYGLFALGVALAVGAVWRRTAAALVVAFVGYFVARLVVDGWLRQHFLTPESTTFPRGQPGPNLNHAWVLTQYPSDKAGHPVIFSECVRSVGSHRAAVSADCLAQHGAGYNHATYFPPHDFWALQGIETALYGGVAVLLIAFAAWWTHSRAA